MGFLKYVNETLILGFGQVCRLEGQTAMNKTWTIIISNIFFLPSDRVTSCRIFCLFHYQKEVIKILVMCLLFG